MNDKPSHDELTQTIRHLENELAKARQAETELRKTDERYRFLMEHLSDTVWILDMNLKPTYVSPSTTKILGYLPEERLNQHLSEMVSPETYARVVELMAREMEREGNAPPDRTITIEMEYYHKEGHRVWMENKVRAIRDAEGRIVGVHGVSRDITDRKRAEEALQKSKEELSQLIETLPVAVCIHIKGKIVYVNPAHVRLFKASSPDEIIGMRPTQLVPPGLFDTVKERIRSMIEERRIFSSLEMVLPRMDGSSITVVATSMPVVYRDQPAILTVLDDVTGRKRNEIELRKARKLLLNHSRELDTLRTKLKEQAFRDPLTGLYNRRYLEETIGRELVRARRSGVSVGVILIDIDRFEQMIDRYGPDTGDRLLQALGTFLLQGVRAGDLACRYGNEDFLLVLPQVLRATVVERAEQWRKGFEALKTPCGEKTLQATLSLGIAVYPEDGETAEVLIREAHQARNIARASGGNRAAATPSP